MAKKVELEESEDVFVPAVGGLNHDKRYIVGVHKPSQNQGIKTYSLLFETENKSKAEEEAEKIFQEDNLEVVIWDRDRNKNKDCSDSEEFDCVIKRHTIVNEAKDDENGCRTQSTHTKHVVPAYTATESEKSKPTKKKIPPSKRR